MNTDLTAIFNESIRLTEKFLNESLGALEQVVRVVARVLGNGNRVLLFGNGGSAADAQHLAAEFVNRYLIERPPLPAVALTTDTSVLTAISNDFSFDEVFAKQIKALGRPGDAAIGISTSGKSANVTKGLAAARELGLVTIGLGGPVDSPMGQYSDYFLEVTGASTPRIQEVHHIVGHALVEMVDKTLFDPSRR
ncbi:MAG: D-sedoheptulose 7-phosphate isomerase [Desulfomonile sp.]|nr:D-sedoheptulose 7-phosphate isomerase [Desulfomonile sp.]